jgi:hypothetical protein
VQLAYPGDFTRVADVLLRESPERAANLRGRQQPAALVPRLVRERARIWTVGVLARHQATGVGLALRTLAASFRVARVEHEHGLTVELWVRRPVPP